MLFTFAARVMANGSFLAEWAEALNVGGIILLAAGIILIVCEMLIPGIGIAGVLGFIATVAGLIVGSSTFAQAAFSFAIVAVILLIAAIIIFKFIFGKRKKASKLILSEEITHSQAESDEKAALIGREGIALTALRPSGTIELEGKKLDVVADGEFIVKGDKVVVSSVEGIRILVKKG